jgi:hypothetical protein
MAMINFYEKMDKKLNPKVHNPHFADHGIHLPFRMIIAGSSGAMKTNTALNIINQMPDTFSKIVIITRNANEPLYNFLREKIPDVEIYEGLAKLPELDKDFDKKENSLVIFDDLVLEKKQDVIEEFAIRCRKLGVSMIYITQVWFRVPKTIRQNLNYIILKNIAQSSDLTRILRDYSLGISKEELHGIYKYATKGKSKEDKTNFLMIDIDAAPLKNFRRNLTVIPLHRDGEVE